MCAQPYIPPTLEAHGPCLGAPLRFWHRFGAPTGSSAGSGPRGAASPREHRRRTNIARFRAPRGPRSEAIPPHRTSGRAGAIHPGCTSCGDIPLDLCCTPECHREPCPDHRCCSLARHAPSNWPSRAPHTADMSCTFAPRSRGATCERSEGSGVILQCRVMPPAGDHDLSVEDWSIAEWVLYCFVSAMRVSVSSLLFARRHVGECPSPCLVFTSQDKQCSELAAEEATGPWCRFITNSRSLPHWLTHISKSIPSIQISAKVLVHNRPRRV